VELTQHTDGFPRLPGRLVSRAWIESPAPTNSHTIPPSIASSSRHSSPLSPPPGASSLQPVDYPPHLPPTLFYGPDRQPLIIGPEDGGFESLGGKLPSKDLNVQDIARLVGPDRMVDVIGASPPSTNRLLTVIRCCLPIFGSMDSGQMG
jgi:F-box/leucine-rich repeat protein 10/11